MSSQANTDLYNWAFGSEPCDSLAVSAQAVVRRWLCSCSGLVPKRLSLPWPMPGVVLPPLKSQTGNLLLVCEVQTQTDVCCVGAWSGVQSLQVISKHSPLSFFGARDGAPGCPC